MLNIQHCKIIDAVVVVFVFVFVFDVAVLVLVQLTIHSNEPSRPAKAWHCGFSAIGRSHKPL